MTANDLADFVLWCIFGGCILALCLLAANIVAAWVEERHELPDVDDMEGE